MEYKRLTNRLKNGAVRYNNGNYECTIYPQNKDMYDETKQIVLRLADLEDMIESGLLFKLPCKEGDPVYKVYGLCDADTKCPYGGGYGYWRCDYKDERKCKPFIDEIKFSIMLLNEVGKTVFTTKEAAEVKLEELRGKV